MNPFSVAMPSYEVRPMSKSILQPELKPFGEHLLLSDSVKRFERSETTLQPGFRDVDGHAPFTTRTSGSGAGHASRNRGPSMGKAPPQMYLSPSDTVYQTVDDNHRPCESTLCL